MKFGHAVWLGYLFLCLSGPLLWAGGSGLNVVVVVNGTSTNSLQVGNYYCERRQVPPNNVLRIYWTNSGPATSWATSDMTNVLLAPLASMLTSRQLTNQIDYLVLSMDIPYRVIDQFGTNKDSTTSALFYGFKTNFGSPYPNGAYPGCASDPPGSSNSYAGSEMIFRQSAPGNVTWSNIMATMITSSGDFTMSDTVIDQGVNSDATFPSQTVFLEKSDDPARNVRFPTFDNAIFNARLSGYFPMQQTNNDYLGNLGFTHGLQSGYYFSYLALTAFVPGAMGDNLTSASGYLFDDGSGQLHATDFLAAGASGSYGTVDEPCNYLQKFPSPQIYFYQSRGFSLAECYYMGVTNPYQGILVGEALAAPFAAPGQGTWNSLPPYALLSGTTNLSYHFSASGAMRPISQADLFVDGVWFQTLTNIPPGTNNNLTITINGVQTNYTVPAGATLASIGTALTARLNANSYSNLTKAAAWAHGDRIELQYTITNNLGSHVPISVASTIGTGSAFTTFLAASGSSFLDTTAFGTHYLEVDPGSIAPAIGSWLLLTITKTNGAVVKVGSTNSGSFNTIPLLVSNLLNMVSSNPQLTGPDGCNAQDFIDYGNFGYNPAPASFNLLPQSPGWAASFMQATLTGSSPLYFSVLPAGAHAVQDNVPDLRSRAHLYLTQGVTNLSGSFSLNTANLPNGYHDLTVVAYEGSHVRTQTRATQTVRIQNGALAATLSVLSGASNTVMGLPLQFSVTANTSSISKIELFGTGGSLGSVTGQSNATFTVSSSLMGLGLHPFYAVVTGNTGAQYRTATTWIRLVTIPPFVEPPFSLTMTSPPPRLSWPATAGRSYDILSSPNATQPLQFRLSIIPSNSPALWIETNGSPENFYKVRTSN
ncbi:MAG: hypothetical protein C5B50_06115 [Verrucomicrobia bacterium]|nr:MAG: hypothetical protein C5B50_06115 [Verrucomicrobiota bacterium]